MTIPTLAQLAEQQNALVAATVAAQRAEVRHALVALAVAARTENAAAAYVAIDPSDQGDWYAVSDLLNTAGESLTDETEVWNNHDAYAAADHAASCLYRDSSEHDKYRTVLGADNATTYPVDALDVAAILTDADELLNQNAGDLPVIAFDGDAAESWSLAFDHFAGYNAHLTLNNGEVLAVQVVGQGIGPTDDALYGIEFKRVADTEDWEPAPGAPVEYLSADDFLRVQF